MMRLSPLPPLRPCHTPVHGELGNQGDINWVRQGHELILQEEEVNAVLCEVLPAEIVAGVILIQVLQSPLQLECTYW